MSTEIDLYYQQNIYIERLEIFAPLINNTTRKQKYQ
jgi:hypothetical protein